MYAGVSGGVDTYLSVCTLSGSAHKYVCTAWSVLQPLHQWQWTLRDARAAAFSPWLYFRCICCNSAPYLTCTPQGQPYRTPYLVLAPWGSPPPSHVNACVPASFLPVEHLEGPWPRYRSATSTPGATSVWRLAIFVSFAWSFTWYSVFFSVFRSFHELCTKCVFFSDFPRFQAIFQSKVHCFSVFSCGFRCFVSDLRGFVAVFCVLPAL